MYAKQRLWVNHICSRRIGCHSCTEAGTPWPSRAMLLWLSLVSTHPRAFTYTFLIKSLQNPNSKHSPSLTSLPPTTTNSAEGVNRSDVSMATVNQTSSWGSVSNVGFLIVPALGRVRCVTPRWQYLTFPLAHWWHDSWHWPLLPWNCYLLWASTGSSSHGVALTKSTFHTENVSLQVLIAGSSAALNLFTQGVIKLWFTATGCCRGHKE